MNLSDKEARDLIDRYMRRPDVYGMRDMIAFYEERVKPSAIQAEKAATPPPADCITITCPYCDKRVFPALVAPKIGKPQMFELKSGNRHSCPGWLKRKEN